MKQKGSWRSNFVEKSHIRFIKNVQIILGLGKISVELENYINGGDQKETIFVKKSISCEPCNWEQIREGGHDLYTSV